MREEFRKRANGFTLIELLVVLGIIAVLVAIALPVFHRLNERSKAVACLSNLRQLGAALNLYLGENGLVLPPLEAARRDRSEEVAVIDNTLNPYLDSEDVFACPADDAGLAATTGTSYHWNSALSGQSLAGLNFLGFIEDLSRIPLLGDKEGFHPYEENKVNILYADGHVTRELRFFTGEGS